MKLITVSGPPSSGKTSLIIKTIESLKAQNIKVGIVKFDCLYTDDDVLYEKAGILVKKGLSGSVCPDHFFASNIEEVVQWGQTNGVDLLITESAGLCNRCSPYLKDIKAVCVIDNLSGINTPKKIGPMLKLADIVVITKGDIVSQAEREVFASRVQTVNPKAAIIHINGLTGQGTYEFGSLIMDDNEEIDTVLERKLRFPLPSAVGTDEGEEMSIDNNELDEMDFDLLDILGVTEQKVESITLLPGYNKKGEKEGYEELVIKSGEIVAIVGPTGSGKSRLLADIEWGAQGDTPTKRTVLVNGELMDAKKRFSPSYKLVAQLSQNMNFVMDLTVREFIDLHAESRLVLDRESVIEKIFNQANELAGEKFTIDTPITSLSGGQSRALMISDTAILSTSPIVLIDEIENAGIDRKKALDLLVGNNKIVLMATHDPILALMGDRRIVIKNGGINKVIESTTEEKNILGALTELDDVVQGMRNKLRYGERLELDFEIKKK